MIFKSTSEFSLEGVNVKLSGCKAIKGILKSKKLLYEETKQGMGGSSDSIEESKKKSDITAPDS